MPPDAGVGLDLDTILALTGRQVAAAVNSTAAEARAEIAMRDQRIAELEGLVDHLQERILELTEASDGDDLAPD